jgi:hypothetical protein
VVGTGMTPLRKKMRGVPKAGTPEPTVSVSVV